tara:strand:- start:4059 stop:4715 length:657 start_codon:yes stop_codon:yes gene_type:complete
MLIGEKISKTFNQIQVLKNVDIKVENGKIVSIFGKSGAGKSTLLYILSSLDKPDKGEVLFDGTKISQLYGDQLSEFRNKKIGFVFQFHNLLDDFDAYENICIPGYVSGEDEYSIKKRADELLMELDLIDRKNHKPNELSGGEQQRVAIARALINSPEIIFADEPTGNLDKENSQNFINFIKKLNKKYNQTFVIVTHNKKFMEISDYSYTLGKGEIKPN